MPHCPENYPNRVTYIGYTNYCHNNPAFTGQDLQMVPNSLQAGEYRGAIPVMPESNGQEVPRNIVFSGGQYQTVMRLISTNTVWLNGASGRAGNLVLGNNLLNDPQMKAAALNRLMAYARNPQLPSTCQESEVACEALSPQQIKALKTMLQASTLTLDLPGTSNPWRERAIGAALGVSSALGLYFGMAYGSGIFGKMQQIHPHQTIGQFSFQLLGQELRHALYIARHPVYSLQSLFTYMKQAWSASSAPLEGIIRNKDYWMHTEQAAGVIEKLPLAGTRPMKILAVSKIPLRLDWAGYAVTVGVMAYLLYTERHELAAWCKRF